MLLAKRPKLITLLAWIAVSAAVAFIYAQGLNGGFVFDDFPNIVDNEGVQPASVTLASMVNAALASPASEFKRPLASLSFAINFVANGMDPVSMKATNIGLHLANGTLLFALMSSLLAFVHGGRKPHGTWTALIVAAAWMLLPINLTAVLYIVQRMESLANLFVLAGLLGYVTGRRRMMAGRGGFSLSVASVILGTGIGALAKETAVLLPLYCGLLEVFVFNGLSTKPGSSVPRRDTRISVLYIVILLVPFILGAAWLSRIVLNPAAWERRDFTLQTRLLSEARIVLDYIAWTLAPTPQSLSFYHDDFIPSTGLLSPWTTLWSLLGIALLVFGAVIFRKRAPFVGLGMAWFLACHTLTATVLPLELIYEHRNYFASIGLALVIVSLLRGELGKAGGAGHVRFRQARAVLLGSLILAWSALLAMTASAWNSPLRMAQELAWRAPDSPRAQYELGRVYIILSRYDPASPFTALARPPLERAMRIKGSSVLPEQALIFLSARMNRPVDGIWWTSMRDKLSAHAPGIQDESALEALSKCQHAGLCSFATQPLLDAFLAAVEHPNPSSRLLAMYADFAWSNLKDPKLGFTVQEKAVAAAPGEMAYRITLARMAIATDRPDVARAQLAILGRANMGGRYNSEIQELAPKLRAPAGDQSP